MSVRTIVEHTGTPVYLYAAGAIRDSYQRFDSAFEKYPHAIHYALKANSTLAILRLLRSLGSRADANSLGEIEVARKAGFEPGEIVFTGVGKRRDELEAAIALGVETINAESSGELDRIGALAVAQGRKARVALRVNPDIDAGSHPHISTGQRINKFGVPLSEARLIYRDRRNVAGLSFVGIHIHIGSQITALEPLQRAARILVSLALELADDGARLEHLDLGGGLGIAYNNQPVLAPDVYAGAVLSELHRSGLPVVLEPGRAIVGGAGALVAEVVDVKCYADNRRFAVLDAGMTELIRPALYGASHRILPVLPRPGSREPWDVVGPICESSDVFSQNQPLPAFEVGDLVAVLDVGAYGAAMGSNYNRRMLPAEVLVDGGEWRVIRRRQTLDDVLALEC
jgi:diaminopimelate decarboxylase